jgi:MOSC domain-containing protein YiiM
MGKVIAIQIAPDGGTALVSVEQVKAVAGQGLEGDRYFLRKGTYSKKHDGTREATFIEAEALEALSRDYGLELSGLESRRNITTHGVALNHLVGKSFRVGGALFKGLKLCEPCGHLEQLTGRNVRPGLTHRGGLRAEILENGLVKVGDQIKVIENDLYHLHKGL